MQNSNSKILIGSLLIIIGLFALSGSFLHLPFNYMHYIFSLPGLLMILGAIFLIKDNDSLLGIIFLGLGGFFFLSRYSHIPIRYYIAEYWPLFLVLFGLYIILKNRNPHHKHLHKPTGNVPAPDIDYIDDFSVFGGGRKLYTSQNLRGGNATAILGGIDLDLHQAALAKGTNILTITAIFGSIDIIVPRDWKVVVNVTSIFGGFDDQRILNANQVYESDKILIIRGIVFFGGGHLKTY